MGSCFTIKKLRLVPATFCRTTKSSTQDDNDALSRAHKCAGGVASIRKALSPTAVLGMIELIIVRSSVLRHIRRHPRSHPRSQCLAPSRDFTPLSSTGFPGLDF